jgi:hypothetical protein
MWMGAWVPLLLISLLAACGGSDDPASLDGRWDGGADWGEVIINDLEGTYSDTFGADPGEIQLTAVSDTEFIGTWNEQGTARFGTLELTLESNNKVSGTWTADPASTISGSSGGLLLWER